MVRYYGYYSNVSRGKRKKQDLDDIIPSILEPEGSSKAFRKNWARLIQKIYETDPLCCPKLVLAKAGMLGKNEDFKFHRGSGGHQEDPQALRTVGYQGQPPARRAYAPEGPPPKATATPPDFHLDYSARPGATNPILK